MLKVCTLKADTTHARWVHAAHVAAVSVLQTALQDVYIDGVSLLQGVRQDMGTDPYRGGYLALLHHRGDPALGAIQRKLSELTHIPVEHQVMVHTGLQRCLGCRNRSCA